MPEETKAQTPPAQPKTPFASMSEAVKKTLYEQPAAPPAEKQEPAPADNPKESEAKEVKEPASPEQKDQKARDQKGRFTVPDQGDEQPKEPAKESAEKPESENIKRFRQEYEKTKKERDALRAELDAARAAADPEEFKRVKQERDEILSELRKSAIERTPEFKREFQAPLDSAVQRALALAAPESKPALESLLRSPPTPERLDRINELISDLSPARQYEITRLAGESADIIERRNFTLENHGKERERYAHDEQAKQQERLRAQQAQAEAVFNETLEAAVSELPLFKEKEGDDKYNQVVKDRIKKARGLLFEENEPSVLAEAAFWAVVGQESLPLMNRLQKLIAEKDAELEKLRNARPMAPKSSNELPAAEKPKTFADAVKFAMEGKI